eukprot:15443545-Alexandrium_andersonii.AAC.1
MSSTPPFVIHQNAPRVQHPLSSSTKTQNDLNSFIRNPPTSAANSTLSFVIRGGWQMLSDFWAAVAHRNSFPVCYS